MAPERGTLVGDLMGSIDGLRRLAGDLERVAREIAWGAQDLSPGRATPRATEQSAKAIIPDALPPILDQLEEIYDMLSTVRRQAVPQETAPG